MDLGQNLRGVDMGPSAVRYAELKAKIEDLGYEVEDRGNVPVPVRDSLPDSEPSTILTAVVDTLEIVYRWSEQAVNDGVFPIFLGGDHSICMGTVGGMTVGQDRCGLIYVDSHGDFNTFETTPSGKIHGMPLAALLGLGAPDLVNIGRPGPKLAPEDVVIIGTRDLDPLERIALKKSGITIFTMRTVDEIGMAAVTHQALEKLSHVDRIHLSVDMDVVDPMIAPGVGTPVTGGLTYREAHLFMEILADSKKVCSVDVAEVNPILDAANRTGKTAVALLASLLGKAII
jgi:arginase